jgi:hypothetical protein
MPDSHAPSDDEADYHGHIDDSKVERGRLGQIYRDEGLVALASHAWSMARHRSWLYSSFAFHKLFKPRAFTFEGRQFPYLRHSYNVTWTNERAVEVPLALAALRAAQGRSVLEIGNVLSHYAGVSHDRLDKYEKSHGVVNADVVDYRPGHPYDLILSISTMEHVGFDERPREPGKLGRALNNVVEMLAPGGRLLVTMPLGYNPEVSKLLDIGTGPFNHVGFLRRISKDNRWVEASWDEVKGAKYGDPYGAPTVSASAIVVARLDKPGGRP